MKVLSIIAVLCAFASPALADVVPSKSGAAHCKSNRGDHIAKGAHEVGKVIKKDGAIAK